MRDSKWAVVGLVIILSVGFLAFNQVILADADFDSDLPRSNPPDVTITTSVFLPCVIQSCVADVPHLDELEELLVFTSSAYIEWTTDIPAYGALIDYYEPTGTFMGWLTEGYVYPWSRYEHVFILDSLLPGEHYYFYLSNRDECNNWHYVTDILDFRTKTDIEVENLRARSNYDDIVISWETRKEIGMRHFYFWRSVTDTDDWFLIPITEPHRVEDGISYYEHVDVDVEVDNVYRYHLNAERNDHHNEEYGMTVATPKHGEYCMLSYDTVDAPPWSNHDLETAVKIAGHTGQALVDGKKGEYVRARPDFYRIDDTSSGYRYTILVEPDQVTNYDLAMVLYDYRYVPLVIDSNPFDGNGAEIQFYAQNRGPYYIEVYQQSQSCKGGTYSISLYHR
jgi:hypothetical protein